MAQLNPIVNERISYINSLQVSFSSVTTLSVTSGQCSDDNDIIDMKLSSAVILNAAINGANGLDTGSLANNLWYYVYVIADSSGKQSTAVILSLSATAPTLPSGYDSKRQIDYWRSNGSAQFILAYNSGIGSYRKKYWDSTILVLTGGAATVLTTIDLDLAVPPVDLLPVRLEVEFEANVAGDSVSFAVEGSTSTSLPSLNGLVVLLRQKGQLEVLSKLATTAKIQYINSAASGDVNVWVSGFDYYI